MDIWKVSVFKNKQNPLYTYAENPKKPGEKPGFLKILQKIISLDLLKAFLAVIELVPDDDFSFFEGFLNINDPLVRRPSELQHEVAFALIIAAIHQNINQ